MNNLNIQSYLHRMIESMYESLSSTLDEQHDPDCSREGICGCYWVHDYIFNLVRDELDIYEWQLTNNKVIE